MSEPVYEVLWPLGRVAIKEIDAKPRIADLSKATIAHLSHYGFRHDEMIPVIEEKMSEQFPGIKFIAPEVFGNIHGPKHGKDVLPTLGEKLHEHGVDGVITGIGSCGTCTPAVARASAVAERAGVPATTIVATSFLRQAAVNARGEGMPDLGVSEFPGVIMTQTDEELRENVANVLVPNIIRELTKTIAVEEEVQEPEARDVVFKGTYDEVQDYFYNNHWTDGLPVTPPTVERVEAFLRYTDRNAGEVLGVIQPANREATIWAVAVNGVMSGCRPEYMPILIGIVEAMSEPNFYARDFGATPGLEPMVIVSGPIVKQLGFNYGTAVMRVGRQSNTSIGRFARMFMRNLVGLRFSPDESDKATIGLGMNVAAAENEDAVTDIGWTSFAQDQGFERGENVVTVQSVMCSSIPIYSAGDTAKEHADRLVEIFGGMCAGWAHTGIKKAKNFPLLLMSPGVAKIIARDGWSKQDLQRYIWENTKIKVSTLYRHAWELGYTSFDLKELHELGMVSDDYIQSDDLEREVRVFVKPEAIGIVLAGDPGRNQSRGYVQNQSHGYPTAKKINLPANWETMIPKI